MRLLNTRRFLPLQVLALLLLTGALAPAQKPKENVSAAKHPNLAAAQQLCEEAFQKITARATG
jgi:hypothetical protein